MKVQDVKSAYQAKLASSGLSAAHAKVLRFKVLEAEAVTALGHKHAVPGFVLPYFTPAGKPTKFYRLRYLASTVKGLKAQTKEKPQRYDQPLGMAPELYFPPLLPVSWEEFLAGDAPLVFTEGELKAACACVMGIPTIALGGVWNFCARRKGVALLPAFKAMNLKGRKVYVVFDSDAVTNPQVVAAENMFCKELAACGAEPYVVRLPSLADGKKCGLDDYLVAEGKDNFLPLLQQAEPYAGAAALHEMNEEVIYIENPSIVLRHRDLYKMSVSTFKNEVYADRSYVEAGEKPRVVRTAEEWIRWPQRAKASKFVYEPGQPTVVNGDQLNLWQGFPIAPVKGDVTLWHKLMDYMFKGDKELRKWFEQWCAYPLQHPGTKMFTAVLLWSVLHGTGKTLVGHTLQRLYGPDNSILIRKKDLASGNNSFAENKQFVLAEEITGDDKRQLADDLKTLITNEEMRINIKYVPEYTVRSCVNYLFTSNNPDAFFIDEADRRYFVHEIIGAPLPEEWYTGVYDPWYKSDKIAALMHYFLALDLTGFSPMGKAPMTAAKQDMIEHSRSALGNWVYKLRENPDDVLQISGKVIPYSLWTLEELLKIYDPEERARVGQRGLGVELKRAGFTKVSGSVRTLGGQRRVWIVRNRAELSKAVGAALLGKLYDDERHAHALETKPKFSK